MTLIGFAFKIAAAPFHLWAPDAYQGAPIPCAAFIASGSKVASFVVLGKIVLIGFAPVHGSAGWHAMVAGWSPVLAVLAALSIVIGNLVALAQSNVRRLLAYSAVAHAGYTLLGLVAGDREGFSAALFYTTIYAVTLVGAFGVVGVVRRETGGDDFQIFADCGRDRRCSQDAWRSSCCRWPVCRRSRDFSEVLFLQRRVTRRRKSRAALAGGTWARRQFRLPLLLPSRCLKSDFCGCIFACSSGTDSAHAIRFFAASYGHSACRNSCFARRNAERFASRILAAIP